MNLLRENKFESEICQHLGSHDYDFSNKRGAYTRTRGLNRETNKELILLHLRHHKTGFIKEFEEVLPSLTRNQIHALLKELKAEGKATHTGRQKLGSGNSRTPALYVSQRLFFMLVRRKEPPRNIPSKAHSFWEFRFIYQLLSSDIKSLRAIRGSS